VDATTGALWVCYYDTREDPTRVRAAYACTDSTDGAASFARPAFVASTFSNETTIYANTGEHGNEYGDYEGVAASGGVAHPAWTDGRFNQTIQNEEIFSAYVQDRG
jgi:hypothetical protein